MLKNKERNWLTTWLSKCLSTPWLTTINSSTLKLSTMITQKSSLTTVNRKLKLTLLPKTDWLLQLLIINKLWKTTSPPLNITHICKRISTKLHKLTWQLSMRKQWHVRWTNNSMLKLNKLKNNTELQCKQPERLWGNLLRSTKASLQILMPLLTLLITSNNLLLKLLPLLTTKTIKPKLLSTLLLMLNLPHRVLMNLLLAPSTPPRKLFSLLMPHTMPLLTLDPALATSTEIKGVTEQHEALLNLCT